MMYTVDMKNIADYGLLRLSGEKAATFLQGQITCDVHKLSMGEAQLGAYCNYQGRVLATFWLLLHEGDYYLILPDEIAAATREVIDKYAVFSKVTVENVSKDFAIKAEFTPSLQFQLTVPDDHATDEQFAMRLVDAEIPMIYQKTTGHFTPHMLNLPALGAVSFDKGCYVGQEIVARTEYRGKVKRCLRKFCEAEKLKLVVGDNAPSREGKVVDFYYPDQGGTVYLAVVACT